MKIAENILEKKEAKKSIDWNWTELKREQRERGHGGNVKCSKEN